MATENSRYNVTIRLIATDAEGEGPAVFEATQTWRSVDYGGLVLLEGMAAEINAGLLKNGQAVAATLGQWPPAPGK